MGSLPQHSATEFRRYMNRALALFPDLSDMTHILRTPFNQYQAFIEPVVAWLRSRGVEFLTGTFVGDIGFAPSDGRLTVNRLDYERGGATISVQVGPEDLVLVTTGSQVADISVGSMTEPPRPQRSGWSWALWKRLAQGRTEFGNPDVFFGAPQVPSSRWVSFTVTTTGTEFIDRMSALTGSEAGTGGLATLKDSGWVLSLTIFHWRGDPGGGAAATAVRAAVGRDRGVIGLHPLRHAIRKQRLDAAQPHRQAAPGSGGHDQSRTDRPVRGGAAGYRFHDRILRPHGVGSDPPPTQARPAAAAGLSGPVQSEGAARRAEGVCLSVTTTNRGCRRRH
jgi:hypothetical protein